MHTLLILLFGFKNFVVLQNKNFLTDNYLNFTYRICTVQNQILNFSVISNRKNRMRVSRVEDNLILSIIAYPFTSDNLVIQDVQG